jgi:hypothetical protein
MGSMTQLEELKLKGNFLDGFLPPEALGNMTRGILAYLRDLHKGAERCYRMKLMFVGKEAAGKSSLSYYLMNNKRIEKAPLSTDGIDINNWDIPVPEFATEFAGSFSLSLSVLSFTVAHRFRSFCLQKSRTSR